MAALAEGAGHANDAAALRGKRLRDGFADASARASDDDALSVQLSHNVPPL